MPDSVSRKALCILVTYNGMRWLDAVLAPFVDHPDFDLWVRDNGSSDGSAEFLQEHPAVDVFEQGDNVGFGIANNRGMCHAIREGYSHVYLLNQDAAMTREGLDHLMASARQGEPGRVWCPVQLNWAGPEANVGFDRYYAPQWKTATAPFDVDFVNAAAWLIPRDVLTRIGGFNPIFFLYGEDRDWAKRFVSRGGQFRVLPDVVCRHDSSVQKKKRSMAAILEAKNYALEITEYFAADDFSGWRRGFLGRAMARSLHRKQWFNTVLLRTLRAEYRVGRRIRSMRTELEAVRPSSQWPSPFLDA